MSIDTSQYRKIKCLNLDSPYIDLTKSFEAHKLYHLHPRYSNLSSHKIMLQLGIWFVPTIFYSLIQQRTDVILRYSFHVKSL